MGDDCLTNDAAPTATPPRGAARRRAADLDRVLREIAARASFMSERHPVGPIRPDLGATPPRTLRRRLARWREVVGRGDEERFRRRLRWDGLTDEAAATLVADVTPSQIRHLPEWTATVRVTIEEARRGVGSPGGLPIGDCRDREAPEPFEDVLLPVVGAARRRLLEYIGSRSLADGGDAAPLTVLSEPAYLRLERSLLARLAAVAAATLGAEFAKRRPLGRTLLLLFGVAPDTPPAHERYLAFARELTADGLESLFRSYPVLARLLSVAVDSWVEATAEFIARLRADHAPIARLLRRRSPSDLGKVVDLAPDLSDPHHGGRAVAALTFECGDKVVYKPKHVGLEVAYTELLRWANRDGALMPLRAQRILRRSGYGWVEYVEREACASADEMRRFYRRAGMLQCLLFGLGATDCHAENLIASGEHPVLVDMETLVHPQAPPLAGDEGQFDSVLRTGLLPRWECQQDTRHLVDLSGLGFVADQGTLQRRWRFVNTDDMYAAWSVEPLPTPRNAPRLDGDRPSAADVEDEFVRGFEEMYRFLVARRDVLLAPDGPLARFRGQQERFLFRGTRIYARIAEEALAPEYLRSGADWSIELEHLAVAFLGAPERPAAWPILRAERRAMERLDVPYLSGVTSGSVLLGLDAPLGGYLRTTGYDEMVARLARLGDKDLALQREIIRGALYARAAEPHAVAARAGERVGLVPERDAERRARRPSGPELFVGEALAIGRALHERAIELSKGRVNWLGLTYIRNTEQFQVNLLSANLYDGVCGVALFLAALRRVTGATEFGDLALLSLEPIRRTFRAPRDEDTRRMIQRLGIGGTLGFGSVLYALCKVGALLGDASVLDDAVRAAGALAAEHIRDDEKLDVMGGAAGAVYGLLALHALTGERAALDRAIACGRRLVSRQTRGGALEAEGAWRTADGDAAPGGFSHGASGIALALLRLYAATGDEAFRGAAARGFASERGALGWHDGPRRARRRREGGAPLVSWCHGAAGIALARLDALSIVDSDEIRRDAELALRLTRAHGTHGLDHLCCGSFGRFETLLAAASAFPRRRLTSVARAQAADVVARAKQAGGYRLRTSVASGRTFDNPALFQGLAGIGYQLLRLARPDAVPSLLLFH